jgi:flagellar biosynthesis protein FliR
MDALLVNLVPNYLPALARIGAILMCAPLVSSSAVPRRMRVLLAMALTVGLMPTIGVIAMPRNWPELIVGVGGEVLIGLAIGMAMNLVFVGAQMAGELIAQQMGLGLAEMFDTQSGTGTNVLGHAYSLLAIVIFLSVNGHHALVRGIGASLVSLPVMSAINGGAIVSLLSSLLLTSMTLALQLAMPVFVTMLIVDLAVGMVGRTVPQVGLMTMGITVRAVVAMIVLVLCLVMTSTLLSGATGNWMQTVQAALPALRGR